MNMACHGLPGPRSWHQLLPAIGPAIGQVECTGIGIKPKIKDSKDAKNRAAQHVLGLASLTVLRTLHLAAGDCDVEPPVAVC